MNSVAPMSLAMSARRVDEAVQTIRPAPIRRAQNTTASPIGPAPITSTRAPENRPETFTACSPTAIGSTRAPSSSDTPEGMRTHWCSATLENWP